MEKGLEQLVEGIKWLAAGGRENAKKFEAECDKDMQLEADLDEATEWLNDVNAGNEI